MAFSKTKIKYFVIFASVCLIFIIALLPFILTWGVNTPYVKNKISDYLYQETNIRIHSSEFSLKLFPKPGIKLNHIEIQPDPETRIEIDIIRLNLDVFTLMQGKLNLGEIIIDHPKLAMLLLKDTPDDSLSQFSFSHYAKKINAGFDLLPENQSELDIIIKNAASDYFDHLDATVTLNKHEKNIHINATIKNFLFPQTWLSNPEFKKHVKIDAITINQIQLQAQIKNAQSIQGNCQLIEPVVAAENKKKLFATDKMNLSFSLSEKSQQIKLEQMKMNYPGGLLGIDFSNHVDQKKSSLVFSGKDLVIHQAKEMSSLMFKDIRVARTIFNILLDGQVSQIDLSFKSETIDTLLDENNLELSGIIQNGNVHIPQTPLIASDIDGTATIKNGVLNINTTRGIINASIIEKGTLMVDLLNYENEPFKGEFNLDVDLSTLPQTLISILPGTLVSEELLKVHHVKGRCKSILNLELKDDSEEVFVQVRTKNFSASGQYDRIPGNIILNNISVEYKPGQITLNNASGTINNTVFTNLYTTIGLGGQTPYVNIHKGSGIINLESAIAWLMSYPATQKAIAPFKEGAGKIFLSSISLSGRVKKIKNWKYNISGNMADINISTIKNQKQIYDLSCNYKISNAGTDLENLKAKIYSLDPLVPYLPQKYLNSVHTPLELSNASLKTISRPSIFKGSVTFSNGPELKIDLQGDTFASLRLNTADLKDSKNSNARISFNADKDKPVFNFSGRLTTESLYKLLKPKSFLRKKLWAITEGQPVTIYTDTDGILNIITKNINVNSFLSDTQKDGFFKSDRMLTEGLINFKADKLKIKTLNFSDVESKMSFTKGHSYIRIKKANLCGLKAGGYLNIKDKKVYASFPLEAKNQENIQSLLTCLLDEDNFMDGPYSFSCNLFANDVELENISNKLNGSFTLNSDHGRIHKLTLLSRILSVLNVSSVFRGKVPDITQKGFAYKNLTIDAQIKDSVIHLTNAVIDGEDMAMIFSGTIDPANDKINLTCLVAPFKTLDLIVEKIPIINTLLGGRLVSFPVKAEGKLSDPQVIPLHPSAVGKEIINMMSRILKTPVTLWEKMGDDDDNSPK